MIGEITWYGWLKFIAAILFFLGPGLLFTSIHPYRKKFLFFEWIVLSFVSSSAIWSLGLILAGLTGFKFSIISITVCFSACWIVLLIRWVSLKPRIEWLRLETIDFWQIVLFVGIGLSIISGLWVVRSTVVGLGSDSYHHTLITQLIIDQGSVPKNYLPYAPIVSFHYHFGFHGLSAFITWFSGNPARLVVPILGQFLVGFIALSSAFLTHKLFSKNDAAVLTGLAIALILIFPTFMLNWGRFTQLQGLVYLPALLALYVIWLDQDQPAAHLHGLALTGFGLLISHYRVALMAIFGVVLYIVIEYISKQVWKMDWRRKFINLVYAGGYTVILFVPWLWIILNPNQAGYTFVAGGVTDNAFSLNRLGPPAVEFLTNPLFILFLLIGFGYAIFNHELHIIWIYLWSGVVILLSGPKYLGEYMDTVTIVISLFIPIAIVLGWIVTVIKEFFRLKARPLQSLPVLVVILLSAAGVFFLPRYLDPNNAYVTSADIKAFQWIDENTSQNALFMVNTYNFEFSKSLIIGIDAGYWLPLLAHRQTITVPMIFTVERMREPEIINELISLHQLNGDLASPQALGLLQQNHITHIFIGERGGPIDPIKIMHLGNFKVIYQTDKNYVFEIND